MNTKFTVANPYNNAIVGNAKNYTEADIDHVLKTMNERNGEGANLEARLDLLQRVLKEFIEIKLDFASLITDETGLCLRDSLHEVQRCENTIRASLRVCKFFLDGFPIYNYKFSDGFLGRFGLATSPIKLCFGITPFNHPVNQVAHKVFPALAVGSNIVIKPSPRTPLSALKLADLIYSCGGGVHEVAIVTGEACEHISRHIIGSDAVELVSLTAGTEVGLKVQQMIAQTGKFMKFIPELGGSSPLIVAADADITIAAKTAADGVCKNSGQRCTAIRRIIVVDDIADQFVAALDQEIGRMVVGNPYEPDTDIGTLIDSTAAEKALERIDSAVSCGAHVVRGNRAEGALFMPTILDFVDIRSELISKETFAPIASVIRVKDLNAAVKVANDSEYKLAGAIVTKSQDTANKVYELLDVGQFNWNGPPGFRCEDAPFGGWGSSGAGIKEGVFNAGLEMTRLKTFYGH